jgi:hypothetical protein
MLYSISPLRATDLKRSKLWGTFLERPLELDAIWYAMTLFSVIL